MELVNIRELYRNQEEYLDKTVTIGGWVRSIRSSKNFGFIVVNDGTFFDTPIPFNLVCIMSFNYNL